MDYRLLGPLEVLDGSGHKLHLGGARQQSVLASLLLRAEQTVALERLIDELWEEPPATAARTVQVYVSRLRHELRDGAIESRSGGYALLLEGDRLDLRAFEGGAEEGRAALASRDYDRAAQLLRQALALWRGPALAGLPSEALRREAERLEELRLQVLEDRLEADLGRGRQREVVPELQALVAEEPFRERPRAQLMLALYRSGRPGDALELYRETRRLLVEELGMEPSQELRKLEQAILQGDRALELPPKEVRSNLPVEPTRLIGRERELGEVIDLLHHRRLLTLTGPGGVGKTRLALEAAAEVLDDFRDGVWFVSLAALREPELVLPTIAQTLEVNEPQTLEHYLGDKQLLLVLDNFEQLVEAASQLSELLARAAGLKLLVTSREPLHLAGEQEYPVPPLTDAEAERLFVERAQEAKPRFRPDEHVGQICRRLDNLPLALELAAPRVKVLTSEELRARLERRLTLLTGGRRDRPERQRTLRATIAWSHDLLTPEEGKVFCGLAVFAGSFTAEAAQHVLEADLDSLQSLVEKSLLRERFDGRFFVLETVREYAAERLDEANETERIRRRHATYYGAVVEKIDAAIRSSDQARLLQQLRLEYDNARSALAYLLDVNAGRGLALAVQLELLWTLTDQLREALYWLELGVRRIDEAEPALRAHALREIGDLHRALGDSARAKSLWTESLTVAQEADAKVQIVDSLLRFGPLEIERALALAIELRDRGRIAAALHELGDRACEEGDLARARALLQRSLEIGRRASSPMSLTNRLHSLGDLALLEGNFAAARAAYVESLQIALELRYEHGIPYCIAGLAAVAAKEGRVEDAVRLWGAVRAVEESRGYQLEAPYRPRYEAILDRLPEAPRLAAAFHEGQMSAMDAAVELALSRA
jgi:predicted ATPase/DNA-binding SARP family transcriptional activator